jgi:probable HAF family extracellular repeat protein
MLALLSQFATAQTTYKITNLGNLGYPVTTASAINDNGDVAGTGEMKLNSSELRHAFLWTKSGGLKNLGTVGGGGADFSQAYGLNLSDQVVGMSTINDGKHVVAFLWASTTGMQSVGNYLSNWAWAINGPTEVVGFNYGSSGRTFAWSSTVSLSTDNGTYVEEQARAVNDSGFVAGYANGSRTGLTEALLWTPSNETFALGTLPGGRRSEALSVSSNGIVAGWSDLPSGEVHPFLWTRGGGMQDLGLLSGFTACVADGVNSSSAVVGQCTPQSGEPHAFVWTPGSGMQDLNNLIVTNGLGTLTAAAAINSSGQIAATAGSGNPTYAVLLNPATGSK